MNQTIKVLLIDDSTFARDHLRRALGHFPCEISEAKSGREAMEILEQAAEKRLAFGLVISDQHMPGMTGLDILRAIQGNMRLRNTPFVLTSAQGDDPVVVTALSIGAVDFIRKPTPDEDLEKKLQAIFKKVMA